MDQTTVTAIAAELLAEHKTRAPRRPHPLADKASVEDAYRVQDELQRLFALEGYGDIVGYKIALTSKAMQQMCGVAHPLAGAVFSSVVYTSPVRLSLAQFQRLGVEFEVAIRLGADCPARGAPYSRESIASAVAACIPAFELVEDRHADYKALKAFDLIADNCWNAGVILGDPITDWRTLDLETAPTRLWLNDEFAGEGQVGDALGHPLEAVAWLANLLNQRGGMLKKDMIVMTGSSITTKFPQAGDRFRFAIDGMGAVALMLDD